MNTVIISCPLDDCSYELDATPPPPDTTVHARRVAEVLGAPPAFFATHALLAHYERVEQMLSEHLDCHEPLHYLRTIQRLNTELTQAKAFAEEVRR